MNHYGTLALRHWQQTRAAELATIEDPQRFFTELGEQVAAEIDRRSQALEGELGENYLANLGMLTEARATAESEVLRELVFTEPDTEPETEPRTEPEIEPQSETMPAT